MCGYLEYEVTHGLSEPEIDVFVDEEHQIRKTTTSRFWLC